MDNPSTDRAQGTDEYSGESVVDNMPENNKGKLLGLFVIFLRLGFTAFGGPAAHIGMFQQEFVKHRKWLTNEQFLDLLGATNLIPGPNSTEMAIHIGYLRAGLPGLILGGFAFTFPAVLIVLALSWVYVRFGTTPQAAWLLYGIKPVMIAIIVQALWELGRKVLKSKIIIGIGLGAIGLYFLGVNEVILIFLGGIVLMLSQNWNRIKDINNQKIPIIIPLLPALGNLVIPFSMTTLFLVFLKIGSVLYGSGYVLLAFLRADLVVRLGWLTEKQLIDAIAIGQITPGPLFTSGSIGMRIAIFGPSFVLAE